MPTDLDEIDKKMIRLLRLNARMSNTKLAAEVGLSPSACLRRMQYLEKSGTIRGYTALVGDAVDTPRIAVIVNITLERQTESYMDRFEVEVRRIPEIKECYLMTGGADYFLRVELDNHLDFERVHKEMLSKLPGVLRVYSSFSIRNVLARKPNSAGG